MGATLNPIREPVLSVDSAISRQSRGQKMRFLAAVSYLAYIDKRGLASPVFSAEKKTLHYMQLSRGTIVNRTNHC